MACVVEHGVHQMGVQSQPVSVARMGETDHVCGAGDGDDIVLVDSVVDLDRVAFGKCGDAVASAQGRQCDAVHQQVVQALGPQPGRDGRARRACHS